MSSTAPAKFTLRSLIVPVFIPSALFSTGEYALVPMIPASAERLGASIPLAGLVAGLVMIGTVFADIPAARVVNRLGERKAMMFSALLASVGIALAVMSQNIWLLSAGVLFVGGAVAVFALARHAYMAEYVPIDMRARALSVLGGMFRLGSFVGPMLSAAAIAIYGVSAALWLASGSMALSVVILIFARGDETQGVDAVGTNSTVKILWRERRKLLTVGTGSAILAMLRTTRIVGLPLWALSLHLPAQTTALYIGIAAALDFALFYTSGQIMDKYGRVWAAVPTLVGLGLTHLAVFLAADATGFLWLALAMALANGLGSGLILVLGADLAPEDARSEFLGGYRVLVDGAVALSSPILSWAALLTGSVAVGMAGFGALGFVGAWLMLKYIPQYAPARSKVDQASPTS